MKNRVGGAFGIAVVFFLTLFICLVQSVLSGGADTLESVLSLLPTEEISKSSSLATLLLPEGDSGKTLPVTADMDLSDLLFPSEEISWDDVDLDAIQAATYNISGSVNVLIYHTHTTEAYRMDGEDTYVVSDFSRTKNNEKNIVQVGEELKNQLESLGFSVIHDTTNHEPPSLSTSYDRSLETMEYYKQKYPDIQIFIDVHRDAADVENDQDDVVVIDGARCARLMFVVGKGEKYTDKPDFLANYTFAKSVTLALDAFNESFTRNIRVKTGRYNQQVSDMCLLVEVGHNANTLQEALNSIPYLAKAIASVVKVA